MSTREDRAHDAERDRVTPCPECLLEGFASNLADCPGHDDEDDGHCDACPYSGCDDCRYAGGKDPNASQ